MPKTDATAAPSTRAPSLVIAGRIVLLILAVGAAVSAFVVTRFDQRTELRGEARYACPMHREVTRAVPGECPICGMALRDIGPVNPAHAPPGKAMGRRQLGFVVVARKRAWTQEIHASAWLERAGVVQALLYGDEIAALAQGEEGVFSPTAAPATRIKVRLAAGSPLSWDESLSKMDFQVAGTIRGLAPGAAGWLTLAARPREVLVVPATAILASGDGPYVLAASPDGAFVRRRVKVGKTMFGLASIVSGLRESEGVVATSAFFLDAQKRMSAGVKP